MLIRTHLAISLFFILLFLSNVVDKLIFFIVVLIATFIPDIDSRFSTVGRKKIARILQFFTQHRGVTHSFLFLFSVTLLLTLFFPTIALGFFLGYSLHLFADSFTVDGIIPFYPFYKKKINGYIRTGGKSEIIVLVTFIILDIILVFGKFGKFI
ncbi:MAG TPA: metal-dependent hydrolase [Candidatus Nanoarchaeia archaeon]|nr:metal-dependent hydrolase [Candidatus Nanoarchaeia archaeon]